MANELTIDQLETDAKHQAILDFIGFYLYHYRTTNLEILAMQKVDYLITDINNFLFINHGINTDKLIPLLADNMSDHFEQIISIVNPKYKADGTMVNSWNQWYQSQYSEIPEGN